jgi:PAS domain S-box-containing protein
MLNLAPLRFKYIVLGLVTPALVDITLLLYFYDRTGYFHTETMFLWAALLVVAGLGTALALRSLEQSLAPLRNVIRRTLQKATGEQVHSIVPQSLDELGSLARDWNQALDKERQQEDRYRDLVEGSIQGIFIIQDMRFVFVNDAFVKMMGFDSEDDILAIEDASSLISANDCQRVMEYSMACLDGLDAPGNYEMQAVTADGSLLWQEVIARRIEWDDAPALQITVIDISDRKKAEQSLLESEARFRDLVEGSIQGIFVHKDFRMLFANQAMADMLGYDGPDALMELDSVLEFVHPGQRASATDIKDARLAGKEAPERYELRAVRRDGSTVWLENVARVVNWGGERAIQATVVDVTERKLAEEALRHSDDSLRQAQRIARIGNWERDFTSGELYWSDEMYHLFGLEPASVKPSYDLFMRYVHPEDKEPLRIGIDRALADEAPYDMDFRVVRPDGAGIVVHAQGEIDREPGGQPVFFRGTAQDVTKLRQAEAEVRHLNGELEARVERRTRELQKAQQELVKKQRLATLGQLTATVSHELRNPLGVMRSSAYVLANGLPEGGERERQAADRLERGIARCDRIIDELLDFTRSAAVDREPVKIDPWLAAILSEQPVPAGIEVITDMGLGELVAMMDPERMRRAVVNILQNASQAITGQPGWEGIGEGGRIVVATGQVNGRIEIQIQDNGPGMSGEVTEKIFEPLFSTKNFGVGLGLPTVQQVLQQHGGQVVFEPVPAGGTLFRLIFPLEKDENGSLASDGISSPADIAGR